MMASDEMNVTHARKSSTSTFEKSVTQTRKRSSSTYEREYPLAAEFKECVEFVISHCFRYLSFNTFRQAFPNLNDDEMLKQLHEQMISSLHKHITETIAEVLADTEIINSLNDLHLLVQSQPFTFKPVWRPAGDPNADLEGQIRDVNQQYHKLFTDMLSDLKHENEMKWEEIKKYESEIAASREDIAQTTNRMKAAEVAAARKAKALHDKPVG